MNWKRRKRRSVEQEDPPFSIEPTTELRLGKTPVSPSASGLIFGPLSVSLLPPSSSPSAAPIAISSQDYGVEVASTTSSGGAAPSDSSDAALDLSVPYLVGPTINRPPEPLDEALYEKTVLLLAKAIPQEWLGMLASRECLADNPSDFVMAYNDSLMNPLDAAAWFQRALELTY
jgi:hypothetical protein